MGASLAGRLQVGRGDLITLSVLDPEGAFDAIDYEVAGVLDRGAPWQDYFVYLTLADLQQLVGVPDAVTLLKLELPGGLAQAGEAVALLQPLLAGGGQPLQAVTYRQAGRLNMSILEASRIQAWMIDIVLLAAVALAVAGAQILAVHERRREFGTMTALGTSRSLVRVMVLCEGELLALSGAAAGALFGVAVTLVLAGSGMGLSAEAFSWMVGGPRVIPRVDGTAMAAMFLELLVVVSLAGLYPAARAARLLPVEALEGGNA